MKLVSLALVAAVSLVSFAPCAFAQEKKDDARKEEPKKDETKKDEAKKSEPASDDAAVTKKLEAQQVNLNFDGTPLADALDTLQELTSINLVVSPAAKAKADKDQAKVTMKAKDLALKSALALTLASAELHSEVFHGVVFVMTKAESEKKDRPVVKLEGELKKKLEAQKVTFNFSDTPLSEVAQFLGDLTGLKFETSEKIDGEKVSVDLRLRNVSAASALAILARVTGLKVTQKKDVVQFTK